MIPDHPWWFQSKLKLREIITALRMSEALPSIFQRLALAFQRTRTE
jgi:hypothetical protein